MGFFKTAVPDESFERFFILAVIQSVRERPTSPNFDEASLLTKLKDLLAIGNGKPAANHLINLKAICSLLRFESASNELSSIAQKAIAATATNNEAAFASAVTECQRWLHSHGVGLGAPTSREELLKKLMS